MNAFSIFGRLTLDDREYQQGLKAAERETQTTTTRMAENWKKVGESLQNTGKNLSLYVTAPIVGIGTAFIAAASDAEETVSKFNTVFRSLGDDADRIADKFADSFGLSSTNARRFLSDTGDLLTGFGFTADAALGLAEEVNSLAIDLASFTNFSGGAEGASKALTAALLGETESAKSLGIVISQELVQARVEELRANGKLLDATDQQAKAYATLQIAQEQSFNAIGDYARTTDSFANQTRRLAQEWNEVAVTFGTVLLPIATDVITRLSDLARAASELDTGTVRLIATIAGIAAVIGPAVLFVGRLVTGYGQLLLVLPRITASFVALRTVMLAMFAPPTGLFLLAAAGVVALGVALFGNRDSMSAKIDAAVEKSRELAKSLGDVNDSESLARGIETLADMIGPEGSKGRVAFQNYADEIVATTETAEEAFARIRMLAFETMNAVELRAARTRLAAVEDTIRTARDLTRTEDSLAARNAEIAALEERRRQLQTERDAAVGNRELMAQLQQQIRDVNSQLSDAIEARDRFAALAAEVDPVQLAEGFDQRLAEAEAEAEALRATIRELQGEIVDTTAATEPFTRAVAGNGAALKNTGDAAEEAADKIAELSRDVQEYLRFHNEARLAAEEASMFSPYGDGGDFVNIMIEPIVTIRTVAEALSDATDRWQAYARAQAIASHEAHLFATASLGTTHDVYNLGKAAILLADRANSIEVGLAGANAELERTPQQIAESATALTQFMETQQRFGVVTEQDVVRALENEERALVALLASLTPMTPAWFAASNQLLNVRNRLQAVVPEMTKLALETLKSADAAAEFTLLQFELGEASETEVTAALLNQREALVAVMSVLEEGSAAWLEARMRLAQLDLATQAFVDDGLTRQKNALQESHDEILGQMSTLSMFSAEYKTLYTELLQVAELMEALGMKTNLPSIVISGTIQEVINRLSSELGKLSDEMQTTGTKISLFALDVANGFATIIGQVPILSNVMDAFSLSVNTADGQVQVTFDWVELLGSMLLDGVSKLESFQELISTASSILGDFAQAALGPVIDVLLELLTALKPLIQIVGEVIRLALQPLVFIWKNVLGPILTGVANAIKAVWNALARAIPGMRRIEDERPAEDEAARERRLGKPEYATSGPYVQVDPETGRARISESSLGITGATAPVGSIQNMRQQIQALRLLYENTLDPRERALAQLWIERFESRIEAAEVLGPGAAAEAERRRREEERAEAERRAADERSAREQQGTLNRLRSEASALQTERAAATDEGRIAAINSRLAAINAEIARLEGLGTGGGAVGGAAPAAPPGTIAALEEERRALQAQLQVASASEIPALNVRISELSEEISRLRGLGLEQPGEAREEFVSALDEVTFGNAPQAIQLAVATPLVEASNRMLDAANVMNSVFGSMLPGQETGFGALPPFTSAIERMTPVLERLLEEGVSVMMRQAQSGPMASPTAFLRGV